MKGTATTTTSTENRNQVKPQKQQGRSLNIIHSHYILHHLSPCVSNSRFSIHFFVQVFLDCKVYNYGRLADYSNVKTWWVLPMSLFWSNACKISLAASLFLASAAGLAATQVKTSERAKPAVKNNLVTVGWVMQSACHCQSCEKKRHSMPN